MLRVTFSGLQRMANELEKAAGDEFADMVETLFYELAGNTPRDTGRAQNSWQVLGRYQHVKVTPVGKYGAPVFPGMPAADRLGNVRIASGVEYMIYLNEGWSDQAPSMFIEKAIAKVMRLYR